MNICIFSNDARVVFRDQSRSSFTLTVFELTEIASRVYIIYSKRLTVAFITFPTFIFNSRQRQQTGTIASGYMGLKLSP
jgi:hypothetical protein